MGSDPSRLTYRRAKFVYEGARLQAQAVNAPVVPAPYDDREEPFRVQFEEVIARQCGPERKTSAEELHNDWWKKYVEMGWCYGPVYSKEEKIHPDMVPFEDLHPKERDKDAVFIALCEIARVYIYNYEEQE